MAFHPRLLPSSRRARSGAFTLLETMVAVAVGAVILTSAVQALLYLLNTDNTMQQELNRKEEVARVMGLLQDEIRSAERLQTAPATSPLTSIDSTRCPVAPMLIIRGDSSAEDIAYALYTVDQSNSRYPPSSWRGPSVLLRCGPPYSSMNGAIDTTVSRSEQVVLDNLSLGSAISPGMTITAPAVPSGTVNRALQLTLNSSVSGSNVARTVQVPINNNLIYGLLDSGNVCSWPGTGGTTTSPIACEDASGISTYYSPTSGGTITGNQRKELVVYLPGKYADFTFGNCTSSQCTIFKNSGWSTRLLVVNGSVLVFQDRELRLPAS